MSNSNLYRSARFLAKLPLIGVWLVIFSTIMRLGGSLWSGTPQWLATAVTAGILSWVIWFRLAKSIDRHFRSSGERLESLHLEEMAELERREAIAKALCLAAATIVRVLGDGCTYRDAHRGLSLQVISDPETRGWTKVTVKVSFAAREVLCGYGETRQGFHQTASGEWRAARADESLEERLKATPVLPWTVGDKSGPAPRASPC